MINSVILNDVILGDGYIKVVTDQGSFIRELHGEKLDSLALKALKSVEMRINIERCPDDQFSGVFKDIHVIGQEEERNQFSLRKKFDAKTRQKI